MRDEVWLKHDARSREDGKMRWFLKRTMMEGYGAFWGTIEKLHYQNDHQIPLSGPEFEGIAEDLYFTPKRYLEILILACEARLFESDGLYLWQNKLKAQQASRSLGLKASSASLREGGRLGGLISAAKRRGASPQEIQQIRDLFQAPSSQASSAQAFQPEREDKKEESVGGAPAKSKPRASELKLTNESFDTLRKEFGEASVYHHETVCRNYLKANGKTKEDFEAFIRNWILKDRVEKKGFYIEDKKAPQSRATPKTFEPPWKNETPETRTAAEMKAELKKTNPQGYEILYGKEAE